MSPIPELSDPSNWESIAPSYASHFTRLTEPFANDVIGTLANHLLAPTTRMVLDVGCGGGAFALAYLKRFPAGIPGQTVRSTDISPAMVAAARGAVEAVLKDRVCATRFVFGVEDAMKLSGVADGSVQAVVSVFGIYLVPDRNSVMREVKRVLSNDVPSAFSMSSWTFAPPSMTDKSLDFGILFQAAIGAAVKLFDPAGFATATEEPDEEYKGLGPEPSEVQELVTSGGLCNARVLRSIHTQCVDDKHDLWVAMSKGNPLVDTANRSEKDLAILKQKYIADIGKSDEEGAVFLFGAANIVIAWHPSS